MSPAAGYSGTPLAKKLGVKPGHRLLVLGAPAGYPAGFEPLPADVVVHTAPDDGAPYDVIVAFCPDHAALLTALPDAQSRMTTAGAVWIAWPKKASGAPTDLVEDRVRDLALARRLVDNKVCAIDATWSGLRLVVRLKDR